MKIIATIGIGLVILLIAAVLTFRGAGVAPNDTVKLGAALALSGDAAAWGEVELQAITMAVEEVNEAGGINGAEVELVVEDTTSNSVVSRTAVSKLVDIDGVDAVIGPTWLDSYPCAQGVVEGRDVILMTPSANASLVNSPRIYANVFSTFYNLSKETRTLSEYLGRKGVKRVALVAQNEPYYREYVDLVERFGAVNGFEVVHKEYMNYGTTDIRTPIVRIKQLQPDALVFVMYDRGTITGFLSDKAAILPDVPLFTDEFGRDYAADPDLAALVEGLTFISPISADKEFMGKFEDRFGEAPSYASPNAYDAVKIIAEALSQDETTPEEFLASKTFDTVTFGPMRFDETNGVESLNSSYVIKQVQDGEVVVVE